MFTMFLMMLAILCAQRGSPSETLTGTLADDSVKLTEFKIMGERNTGTRYLQKLLVKNLKIPHLRLNVSDTRLNKMSEAQKDQLYQENEHFWGWKHSCAPTRLMLTSRILEVRRLLFVVTAKNPYSWLLSIWRHPYHYVGERPATFEKFLRRPWMIVNREGFEGCGGEPLRHKQHRRHFKNPVDLWNSKLLSYARLAAPHVAKVKYEDLVEDPAGVVRRIAEAHGIGSGRPFANIAESTKAAGKSFSSYKEYYSKEKWKGEWECSACLKLANMGLDDAALDAWGYARWQGDPGQFKEGSWMTTPKPGVKVKDAAPVYVSKAALLRQLAKAEAAQKGGQKPKGGQKGGQKTTKSMAGWEAIGGFGEAAAHRSPPGAFGLTA